MKNILYQESIVEIKHLFRMMRNTLLALFVFSGTAFATESYSQTMKVTVVADNVSTGKVISEIEKQTDYLFVYNVNEVNLKRNVKVNAQNKSVAEVLNKVFEGTDIYYAMEGKNIMLMSKAKDGEAAQQANKVTGIVKDANGEPVIGANVTVKGQSIGTITDIDGRFVLDAPKDAVLQITYIGYVPQEVKVFGKKELNVVLKEDTETLDEVVVVGYGTVKKSNVVGSIAKVTSEALEDRPVARVEQALQGQMAGVSVRTTSGAPGSDITINVRGTASINGESTPLYVVDGVPVDNLSGINPNDIESIDVLKDAASASIYGSRGSNGVVLVTTKKGKTGKPIITLNAYAAVSSLEKKVDVMDSNEWIAFNKKWYDRQWVNSTGQSASVSQADRIAYAQQVEGKDYSTREALNSIKTTYGIYDPWWGTKQLESIDWQEELFREAPSYDIQLNASGATERLSYLISGGIFQQKGIVYGSSYDRYTLRANIEAKVTDRIKVGLSLAPSYGIQKGTNVDGRDNAVSRTLAYPGWVLPSAGRMAGADPYKFYGEWGSSVDNVSPYVVATAPTRRNQDVRMNSSLNTTINIIEGLDVTGMVAWNYRNRNERSYSPTWANGKWNTATHPGEFSNASYATKTSHNLLFQGLLTYDKTWNIHSINAMLGASYEKFSENTSLQKMSNFPNDKSWIFDKNKGTNIDNNEIDYNEHALISYFGRIQYALMDRYLMTVSLRRDGSSKFGSENRWGVFPSISGAWKISEESFMRNLDWVGTTKLRLSWGQSGNDRIGSAQFLSNMIAMNYPFGTSQNLATGYVTGNIANALLGWETTTSYNIGVDFGVLNNRIYLSADYYKKRTKDLLLNAPVSLITGFSNMMDNVGNVDNWGIELELNTANISTPDFKWNSSLNISLNRNKIVSLGDDDSDIRSGQGNTIIQRVGHPINSYMLLKVERTLRTDDFEADGITPKKGIAIYAGQKPGDTKWVDQNKDGKITSDDYNVTGSYQPKFEWGFTNTFKYKNIDASILLQGRVGGKLLSIGSRSWNRATNDPKWNYMSRWLHDAYWSEEEPGDGKTPAFYATTTGGQYDTNWLYDAGYVRIKNVTLGYSIPFKPNHFISKARVYISCDNVCMWDHYDAGFSPEAATQDNASSDWGAYPQARTFSFGFNLTF